MTENIQKRLLDYLSPRAEGGVVEDVRIGLGYTVVKLKSGHAGVAWTPRSEASSCTHFRGAGTLAGQPVTNMLRFLVDEKAPLVRAIGLAAANAMLAALPRPAISRDEVISTLNISPGDRVAMVGYFGPVVADLRKSGCQLDVVELIPRPDETLTPDQGREALAHCDIAILTGTSMINGTCDALLASLGRPRAAVLLGPSSPLCPEVFVGSPITHIAGSRVRDADAVLRIASEGGGTMLLKKHMDFETVLVKQVGSQINQGTA